MIPLIPYQVGDVVVCINDTYDHRFLKLFAHCGAVFPRKGGVYTVRQFISLRNNLGVRLREIRNPLIPVTVPETQEEVGIEPAFHPDRFRPAKKTDISVFTSILAPKLEDA
jgi:hypothetical protein